MGIFRQEYNTVTGAHPSYIYIQALSVFLRNKYHPFSAKSATFHAYRQQTEIIFVSRKSTFRTKCFFRSKISKKKIKKNSKKNSKKFQKNFKQISKKNSKKISNKFQKKFPKNFNFD